MEKITVENISAYPNAVFALALQKLGGSLVITDQEIVALDLHHKTIELRLDVANNAIIYSLVADGD